MRTTAPRTMSRYAQAAAIQASVTNRLGMGQNDMPGNSRVSRQPDVNTGPLARPVTLRQNPVDVVELADPAGRAQEGRHLGRAAPSWVLKTAAGRRRKC